MAQPNQNQQLVFNITGNSQGLVQALQQSERALSTFGKNSGGVFSTVSGGIGDMIGRFTSLNPVMLATSSVATAMGAAFVKVGEQAEKAMEIIAAASKSGMSTSQLQQLANVYRQTGLTLDNIADQQKDLKDKLQDALFNNAGSMLTDVIQPLKLNIFELQKMASAGEDVYSKIYFSAKAQGYSNSELVNMFETLGNDATSRLAVLQQFNTEQDYQNSLSQQTVTMTEDQIAAFKRYDAATNELSNTWQKWLNDSLSPVADTLAGILETINKINATGPVKNPVVTNLAAGASMSAAQYAHLIDPNNKPDVNALDAQVSTLTSDITNIQKEPIGSSAATLKAGMAAFQTSTQKAQATLDSLNQRYQQTKQEIKNSLQSAYNGDVAAQTAALQKLDSDYQAKLAELNAPNLAKQKAAADKAAAAAKAAEQKRIQAQQQLNAVLGNMGDTAVAAQLAKFDYQQNEMERKIRESAKTLGLSEADTTKYLEAQYKSRSRAFSEMVDQMVSESDPEKLKANLDAIGNRLNPKQTQKVLKDQSDRVSSATGVNNSDNPFSQEYADSIKEQQSTLKDSYTNELGLLEDLNRKKLISVEQYNQKKSAYESAYQRKTLELESQTQIAQMGMISTATSDMATMMAGAFGESSGAAQAFFALSKGVAVATSIIKIQQALSEALATPFPQNIAMYAQVLSLGAGIISTIKGTNIQGQAHDGIDSIPNEGTWNLAKGERVLSNPQAKKLDNYLDKNQNASTQPTQQTVINAPLVVQGGSSSDDAQFQAMLKKHKNNVNQAVRQSQQRNT
ncbi:hypothetical protein DT73_13075 [Mangrovibacter sp. MFB070]|uniref:hypothetical protein n=1 Tax=Mangrovibacter sp. MFB070 TaxID=1224318 RepID=UPI0004D978CF|nr:hypothetical protein [Mangrovibacter sp. MFB070]KEA51861.1 hypothetical protein DT73_13075 [Mangrovibacter sp. MFB070]